MYAFVLFALWLLVCYCNGTNEDLSLDASFSESTARQLQGQGQGLGKGKAGKGQGMGKAPPQKRAIMAWAASLTSNDEDPAWWAKNVNSNPPQQFDHYIVRLSKVFALHSARVNFVSIGACDGTNDHTITQRYFKNPHWDGLFVEPMSINYRDLVDVLKENDVFSRSFALRAAATSKCENPTLTVTRPLYEDKGNHKAAHWLRRQIGSIKKAGATTLKDWGDEEVLCVTGPDAISHWVKASKGTPDSNMQTGFVAKKSKLPMDLKSLTPRRRPHILKVDVEGHDKEVIFSFLENSKAEELPLLVMFEAKSLGDDYDATVALMSARGYVVSEKKSDGFALLRAEKVMKNKAGRKNWEKQLESAARIAGGETETTGVVDDRRL